MEPGREGGQLLTGLSEDELEHAFGRALAPPPELTADDLIEITQPAQQVPPPTLASVLAEIPDLPPPEESLPVVAPVVAWGQLAPKPVEPAEPRRRRSSLGVVAIMAAAAAAGLAIGVLVTRSFMQGTSAPRRASASPRALVAGRAAPPAPEVRMSQAVPGFQAIPMAPAIPPVAAFQAELLPGRPVTQVEPVPSGPIAAQVPPSPETAAPPGTFQPGGAQAPAAQVVPSPSAPVPPADLEASPANPAEPPKRTGRAVPAQLTPAAVMRVVVAHKADVVACLDAARAEDPELTGTLEMRWTVAPGGEVESVEVVTPELQGSELGACVAAAISGWRFPRHTEAQPPITFPFRF